MILPDVLQLSAFTTKGNKHMKNNNTPNIKNQVKFKIADHPAIKELKTQPVKSLEQYSNGTLDILNYIILLLSHFGSAFPKQQTIASRCDLTREHVNRCISRLTEDGLIDATHFNNHPNTYRVAPEFFQWDIIEQLAPILPALKMLKTSSLALGILFSNVASGECIEKKITHIKNSSSLNKFIYKRTYSYTYREEKTSKKSCVVMSCNNKNYLNKKESSMDDNFYQTLLDTAWLTDLGRAGLSAYPEKAVLYALQNIKRNNPRTVRDPFKLLCKIAKDYTTSNNLIIDWKRSKQLEEKYSHLTDHVDRDLFIHSFKTSLKGEKREVVSSSELQQRMKADSFKQKLYDKDWFVEIGNFYTLIKQPNFQWICDQVGKSIIPGYILDVLFFSTATPEVLNELVKQYPPLSEAITQIAETGRADLAFEGYWDLNERPYLLSRQL